MQTRRRAAVLALMVIGAGLGGRAAAGGAGAPPPDAFTLYDTAARLLRTHYAGRDMLALEGVLREQRETLAAVCEGLSVCLLGMGREALEAVMIRLDDQHTGVSWTTTVSPQPLTAAPRRRWSGLLLSGLGTGELAVRHVDHGSPAERAGLRPLDVITAVEDQEATSNPADLARHLWDAETQAQQVTLRVRRDGQIRHVTVTPALWPVGGHPTLRWVGQTAVISVPTFGPGAGRAALFGTLMERARAQGATGLVVDLRENPGGLASECLTAAQWFAGDRVNVVSIGRSGTPRFEWRTTPQAQAARARVGTPWAGPLALLVSEGTASCGEMLAYWGQRAGGVVMGEPTLGALHTSARHFNLPGGGALFVTAARMTLDGRQRLPERVEPDVPSASFGREFGEGHDLLLEEAVRVLTPGPR